MEAKRLMNDMELKNRHHLINSGDVSNNNQDILTCVHNAGLFSNATIALQDILMFYNEHHKLPDVVDRFHQYIYYKQKPEENLIPMLFKENVQPLAYRGAHYMTDAEQEQQFSNYKLIRHDDLKPFIERYFMPSDIVMNRVREFEERYNIDYENTVGVFHRSNDKIRETGLATDEQVIEKAKEFDGMRYFILPDHWQFLTAFKKELPNSFYIAENNLMDKDETKSVFMILPPDKRPEHAVNFFASVIIMSRCKHIVGHSGNCMFWTCLYRGNSDNIVQYLNGEWL